MRRRQGRTTKRAWAGFAILGVVGAACLAGGWRGGSPHETEVPPAEIVAARFPKASLASADVAVAATIVGQRQLALFSPEPISRRAAEPVEAAAAEPTKVASVASVPVAEPTRAPSPPVAHATPAHPKPVHHTTNRPGFVLNDGQIASIKRRLNLTPDQERMWPAVEAALRNIAYAKAQAETHRQASRAGAVQLASVDPDSPEVVGLKSAAFPLIMSFSAEQKSEVRSLAHVMGLDKLASQF